MVMNLAVSMLYLIMMSRGQYRKFSLQPLKLSTGSIWPRSIQEERMKGPWSETRTSSKIWWSAQLSQWLHRMRDPGLADCGQSCLVLLYGTVSPAGRELNLSDGQERCYLPRSFDMSDANMCQNEQADFGFTVPGFIHKKLPDFSFVIANCSSKKDFLKGNNTL